MKKILCILLAALLAVSVAVPYCFAEEAADGVEPGYLIYVDAETETVVNATINGSNNIRSLVSGDVVKFAFTGEFDPMMDIRMTDSVDTEVYPILALKVQNSGGTERTGEIFYNEMGKGAVGGMSATFEWEPTTEWQWAILDLTGCGSIGYMRFDVFGEGDVDVTGMIAALAFFKNVDEANAYIAGDAAAALGSHAGDMTIDDQIKAEESRYLPLFDTSSKIDTGWWFHPYSEGKIISAGFESDKWFDSVWFFAYASSNPCPIVFSVLDENEETVFTKEIEVSGNTDNTVKLEKSFAPGFYYITFESVELDEPETVHFVLGSAEENEDMFVEFSAFGANTNDSTQAAPAIKLGLCDPDPDYTEKPSPTEKPTPTQAQQLPTPIPTEAPATEAPTEAPAVNDPGKRGANPWLIAGIIAAVAAAAGAVTAAVISQKKKKAKTN